MQMILLPYFKFMPSSEQYLFFGGGKLWSFAVWQFKFIGRIEKTFPTCRRKIIGCASLSQEYDCRGLVLLLISPIFVAFSENLNFEVYIFWEGQIFFKESIYFFFDAT